MNRKLLWWIKPKEQPAEPPQEVKPTVTVFNCMMDVFRDAMFNLNQFAIKKPDWYEDVNNEYMSMRENKNNLYVLDLMKEIVQLNSQLFIIAQCLSVLEVRYVRELVLDLKQEGCSGRFDWSNKAQYRGDLKAAASRSKRLISQRNRLQEELDAFHAKYSGGDVTPDHFDDWAVELSKFMGYNVRLDQTTVSTWVKMMNKYDRYSEVVNAEQNNLLTNGK
jgi:hypothetical protein